MSQDFSKLQNQAGDISWTDLEVSREGEVLPERVPLEAVVGEDSSEVRVAGEVDAKHVEDLPFVPEMDTKYVW